MATSFGAFREWRLRLGCRRLLRELDVPVPLDVQDLCRRVGDARGRPVELYPYPIEVPGPFGLWFALADRDAIFYQQETVPWHQNHIILHELGHLLGEHPSDAGVADTATMTIRRSPPAGLTWREDDGGGVQRRRTCFEDRYEREAELYATIIQEWGSVLTTVPAAGAQDSGERRIAGSLRHHRGWL